MSLIGSDTTIKGALGFKGEKGDSAYQVAVNNGFIGTEQDWLATIGTTNYVGEKKATYSATSGQKEFGLPTNYTDGSVVEVYVEGAKLDANSYTVNEIKRAVVLANAIAVNNTTVEIVLLTMASYELPIVETINEYSSNETTPGTKAVYDFVKAVENNIKVVTGSTEGISAGETVIKDVNYPSGFNKGNTSIIGKMTSSNNVYYDTADTVETASGFPVIEMIALTDATIRLWIKNTNSTEARIGHFKLTLLKKEG